MKTFLFCYCVLSLILVILSIVDITYYDIKWTIKNYEKIDEMADYYAKQLKEKKFTNDNYKELENTLFNYDYWMNLKNTKDKIKRWFHI